MTTTPSEAVNEKERLTQEFSGLVERMKPILRAKPKVWLEMKKLTGTAKETDMLWAGSEMGIEEMEIKLSLDVIKHKIASLNTFIKNAENEARNLY